MTMTARRRHGLRPGRDLNCCIDLAIERRGNFVNFYQFALYFSAIARCFSGKIVFKLHRGRKLIFSPILFTQGLRCRGGWCIRGGMISNRSLRRRENKVKRYRGCLWLSGGFYAGLAIEISPLTSTG